MLLLQLVLMWVSVGCVRRMWMQWMWMLSCHKGRWAQTLQQLLLVQQERRMAARCRPHHSARVLSPQTQALLLLLSVQTDRQHHQLLGLVSMEPLHLCWALLPLLLQQWCLQYPAVLTRQLSCGS